ncbi:hypothetical protein BN2475_190189 [Paraburkholderia ribeironis]|uniref:EamA domain-containing protein n=1 Tax=Paraburkholderia ribeironis TaxID=1247936 RepID=A0A1N7RW67_9BURK|nr:hypothetical protein BN2475_190189 [Paraburkholderia ribeironis]
MSAAAIQLLVPPIAALGGVLFRHEPVSPRLTFSFVAVLVGISLTASASARHNGNAR